MGTEAEKVLRWATNALLQTDLTTRPPAQEADLRMAFELYRAVADAVIEGEEWAKDPAKIEQCLRRAGDLMATGGAEWTDELGTAMTLAEEAAKVR